MITTLFGKSKPINFLILGFVLSAVFVISQMRYSDATNFSFFVDNFFLGLLLFFCVWLLSFIVYKNKLSQSNHYALFFFTCFLIGALRLPTDSDTIFSLAFVTLALRRILALRSNIDVRQKVFDASFWLTVAMLFNFWTILFVILLYVALLYFIGYPSRIWFIPFVAFFSAMFPVFAYCYVFDGMDRFVDFFRQNSMMFMGIKIDSPDFVFLIICILIALFSMYFYLRKLKLKAANQKKTRELIIFGFLLSLLIYLLSNEAHPDSVLLIIPFLSVISVTFAEDFRKKILLEIYLLFLLGGMIALHFW